MATKIGIFIVCVIQALENDRNFVVYRFASFFLEKFLWYCRQDSRYKMDYTQNLLSQRNAKVLKSCTGMSPFEKNLVLPLTQLLHGKTETDTSVDATGTSIHRTDHLALWAQDVGGVHNAANLGLATKASDGQVKVFFHALPCFVGTAESGRVTRRNFNACFLLL